MAIRSHRAQQRLRYRRLEMNTKEGMQPSKGSSTSHHAAVDPQRKLKRSGSTSTLKPFEANAQPHRIDMPEHPHMWHKMIIDGSSINTGSSIHRKRGISM